MIVLTPDDAIALLRSRLARLSEQFDAQRAAAAEVGAEVPRLFLIEDEYRIAMTVAEAEWTRSLVDELSSGTFPMLEVWRQWRESGAIPTELSELPQRGTEHDEEQT
ncbi:MAG: putative transcriptional regulator [Mycobacterium sp.]|nr:putative transcriptional regulator [Mycobacterium sp.]